MSALSAIDLSALPTEFRGCQWNDHWEFGAPSVIYFPKAFRRYSANGGNTGELASMVEDICINLSLGLETRDGGLEGECKWRGWSLRGFARRRDARHVVFKIRWKFDEDGRAEWEEISHKETYGLPTP